MDPPVGRILRNLEQLATGDREYRPAVQWYPGGSREAQASIEHLVANTPISRALTSLRTMTDPRKDMLTKAFNLTTGLRVSDISPAAQDAAFEEKLKAASRDLGGRIFSRVYMPDWAEETLTPAQQEKWRMFNAMFTTLADRTRERKARRLQDIE
jgi:hypothetical protein